MAGALLIWCKGEGDWLGSCSISHMKMSLVHVHYKKKMKLNEINRVRVPPPKIIL